MANYRILYWHDIPSMVEAKDEEGNLQKEQLSPRFQELIDHIAMRKKLVGTDAYLEGWRRSHPKRRDGSASDVARTVASEMEAEYEEIARTAKAT